MSTCNYLCFSKRIFCKLEEWNITTIICITHKNIIPLWAMESSKWLVCYYRLNLRSTLRGNIGYQTWYCWQDSDLYHASDYPDLRLSWYFAFPPGECRDNIMQYFKKSSIFSLSCTWSSSVPFSATLFEQLIMSSLHKPLSLLHYTQVLLDY
jgi:hypothetical protein